MVVSVTPLPSAKTARWIKKNMTDSLIPKPIIERLEDAEDPESEGIDICVETMREIAGIPGVSGINLMTTGDAGAILSVLKAYAVAAGEVGEDT